MAPGHARSPRRHTHIVASGRDASLPRDVFSIQSPLQNENRGNAVKSRPRQRPLLLKTHVFSINRTRDTTCEKYMEEGGAEAHPSPPTTRASDRAGLTSRAVAVFHPRTHLNIPFKIHHCLQRCQPCQQPLHLRTVKTQRQNHPRPSTPRLRGSALE